MANKTKNVSLRISETEYDEVMAKISVLKSGNKKGKPTMNFSQFVRMLFKKRHVVIVDQEVEEYKVAATARIGNNINQIARRLNADNLKGKIDFETYDQALEELRKIRKEMYKVLSPIL